MFATNFYVLLTNFRLIIKENKGALTYVGKDCWLFW